MSATNVSLLLGDLYKSATEEIHMPSSPPIVIGVEELYADVPVAGRDHRLELDTRVALGRADVFQPDADALSGFDGLVGYEKWAYSYVVLPLSLEPLNHGSVRQVTVTASFADPEITARPLAGRAPLSPPSTMPTRGLGFSRVTWVLEPPDDPKGIPPEGHMLGCLLRRPKDVAATDVVIEISAVVARGLAVRQQRVVTMKEPQPYRIAFEPSSFVRLSREDEEGDDNWRVVHTDVPAPALPGEQERTVIVFHGRDTDARKELFTFLRALGLHPLEWLEVLDRTAGHGSPYIGDSLDAAMKSAQAILVFMTPDDVVRLKPEHADEPDDPELRPQGQARPNVLFETGLAMGRHPERTILVEFGKVRQLSDLGGRYILRLNNTARSRHRLARRLTAVGCAVDTGGTDWLNAGDLTPPTVLPRSAPETTPTGAPRDGHHGRDPIAFHKVTVKRNAMGYPVVYGEVVVNTGSPITLLTIEATFYDQAGGILGSAQGNVSDLVPQRPKNFQLVTYEDLPEHAEVRVQVGMTLP
ncbi:TIR domain-containing protein [Streptomyces sp. NPDC047097]|uniref:TIR domain-containing protein n=1 Tax=Streptomyces sp. NPDC047097 TaxID=3155260 RepID=UPI0034028C64